jgi:hypothetical protein
MRSAPNDDANNATEKAESQRIGCDKSNRPERAWLHTARHLGKRTRSKQPEEKQNEAQEEQNGLLRAAIWRCGGCDLAFIIFSTPWQNIP